MLADRFLDRSDAGRQLAEETLAYANRDDVVVLGLPRGGIPVAYEVAQRLHAPLDVFMARKLTAPGYPELAMGAIASGGVRVVNPAVLRQIPNCDAVLEAATAKQCVELERREYLYRGDRAPAPLRDQIILLVDDGLATGATMRAAIAALRHWHPHKIIVAVPVGTPEACHEIRPLVDQLICLLCPEYFQAVGQFYVDFTQTTDEQVSQLLAHSVSLTS